jgi:hypothetical protein
MTQRMTLLRLLIAMLLGAIGWAGATATASAGGPTSVLMTNPESGRASAFHISNAAYDRLYAAVGEATGDSEPPSGLSLGGEEVRLTWLIHDVRVWRIDQVHLTRNDGIWLETVTELTGQGHPFDQPAQWHRAKNDQALTALLANAGLLGADSAPSSPPSPDDSSPVTVASSAPSRPVLPIIAAAVGGLAVGAVGSLLLRRRPVVNRPRVTLSG